MLLSEAFAAVTIIGTQYNEDRLFPEFNCYYSHRNYPVCPTAFRAGATAYVYVKNTGSSSVTISDATLAGYSLQTVIKMSTASWNPDEQNSIFFYWDDPPQEIIDAGEPVWWKADPPTVPAGGVAQVAIRLRQVPTNHIRFGVVTSAGTLNTNLTVDAAAPRITSIGYSEDLRKVYIHWRREGGAAPVAVWLNGSNVTALTTTVGDPSLNFAVSMISLGSPLPYFSYNVYQGVYADGKTATAGQRAWTNKFIYCTWSTFQETADYTATNWVEDAAARGFNNIEMNLGMLGGYMGTSAGRNHMLSKGYGYTILDKTKLNPMDPDLWFINDEPDAEENNQGNTHCGTGLRLPCDSWRYAGTLVMKEAVRFTAELRALRPNVPITVNLDGGLQPQSFYTWGPAVDVLESDNYYEPRLADAWYNAPQRLPLHNKPKLSYAIARTGTEGAAPHPFRHILYACKQTDPVWPYPFPQSKRMEAYYSLAGGSKGLGYWWFNSPRGLYNAAQAPALWREMGLIGNEVRTARQLIVRSTPVDLPLYPSTNVWARAVASGIDTLILYVVNDNYANDITGCKVTNVPNATVTLTLPLWMQTNLTAFEITAAGTRDVSTLQTGSQLQVNLGTLELTRMIILTTDPSLRTLTQQTYDLHVRPNVCSFAPELCTNNPPVITQHPVNRSVAPGGTTNFIVVATGSGTLGYQWQKNSTNLVNGGHYSGVTTSILTISNADSNDVAGYRCIVTNAYGSATSVVATLTLVNPPGVPTALPATSVTDTNFTANWAAATNATGYRLDVATDPAFSNFVPGYNNLDVGNVLSRVVSGLTGATTYYYRVRAYNAVATSANSATVSVTTSATVSPPGAPTAQAATGVTSNSFTANWSSAIGATGYRLDVSPTNTFASFLSGYNNLDVGNVLSRTVTGLTPGATYYYRVRAYNSAGTSANSATVAVTLAPPDPCVALFNAGFEDGFSLAGGGYIANGWTEWEAEPGVVIGYDETTLVRSGAHSQRIRVWGTNPTAGGVYQRIPVTAGGAYAVAVWAWAADTTTACSLGVDPAGGTNANSPAVVWTEPSTNAAWTLHSWAGIATGHYLTVFLRVASADNQKRNGYFDDATPAPPTTPLQLLADFDGELLYLVWPECPKARLEWTADLLAPAWTAVTNPVNALDGWKSIALPPTGNSGYFRLVAE